MARPKDTEPDQQQAQRQDDGGEGRNGHSTVSDTLTAELSKAVREAAMEVLGPVARQATSSAAKYAVKKGPELVKDNVMPAIEKQGGAGPMAQQALSKGGEALSGAGGLAGIAGKLASKLGGGGGGAASGWGRNRRMPVQQWIYVSVPVGDAYNAWTEYKQWPRYMHRANQVDPQVDDKQVRLKVTEKMWGFTRPFTAEVICQRPDELIRWNSTEGSKHTGVINFHELGTRLTLIEVNLDHAPSGIVEKISRGARFTKRAVRADLHRFQAWVEMKSDDELEEIEGWRGRIEDGQIVQSHEDTVEEERRDRDRSADDQGFDDERDEPEAGVEDEFDEPEDEEFDEPKAGAEDEFDEPEDDEFDEPEAEAEDNELGDEAEDEESEDDEPEAEAEDDELADDDEEFDEPEAEESDEPEADAEDEEAPRPSRRRRSQGRQGSRRQRATAAR